jgi:hypothetical protein
VELDEVRTASAAEHGELGFGCRARRTRLRLPSTANSASAAEHGELGFGCRARRTGFGCRARRTSASAVERDGHRLRLSSTTDRLRLSSATDIGLGCRARRAGFGCRARRTGFGCQARRTRLRLPCATVRLRLPSTTGTRPAASRHLGSSRERKPGQPSRRRSPVRSVAPPLDRTARRHRSSCSPFGGVEAEPPGRLHGERLHRPPQRGASPGRRSSRTPVKRPPARARSTRRSGCVPDESTRRHVDRNITNLPAWLEP